MNVVDEHRRRIASLVPGADVRLTGSASVPGLDAADVDLVVLSDDVHATARLLARAYPRLYPEEWRDDWAAFRDPGPPQVDVVVTRPGSRGDAHHRLAWELLAADPQLVEKYRSVKGDVAQKAAFFERLVGE